MGENTKIEWCDFSWNPWIGCTKVAPGCAHCYAESFAKRTGKSVWGPNGTRVKTSEANWSKPVKWNKDADPLVRTRRMKDPIHIIANAAIELALAYRPRVFCASLADVFEEWDGEIVDHRGNRMGVRESGFEVALPQGGGRIGWMPTSATMERPGTMDDLRSDLFALIDATPNLDWLLLTKRPENIRRMWPVTKTQIARAGEILDIGDEGGRAFMESQPDAIRPRVCRSNVWLGCSIANQEDADTNIPELLKCRDLSPVLFLSCEPLIGPVDLKKWLPQISDAGQLIGTITYGDPPMFEHFVPNIDWVIVGGESGPKARPCDLTWIRSIRKQCKAVGVSCFIKQLGARPYDSSDENGRCECPQWTERCESDGHPTGFFRLKDRKGGDPSEWLEDLRVREFPVVNMMAK